MKQGELSSPLLISNDKPVKRRVVIVSQKLIKLFSAVNISQVRFFQSLRHRRRLCLKKFLFHFPVQVLHGIWRHCVNTPRTEHASLVAHLARPRAVSGPSPAAATRLRAGPGPAAPSTPAGTRGPPPAAARTPCRPPRGSCPAAPGHEGVR